jgi:hypothetical protein
MTRIAAVVGLVLVLAVGAGPATAEQSSAVTPAQLVQRFRQATGDRLVLDKVISEAGHYQAYDYGHPSIAKKAKYGTFIVYVVTGADVEAEVRSLLIDAHTGQLGTPGPGRIYWESGTTIHGDRYWMAKRRYGENVVLEWMTESRVRKTDRTFKALHKALTKATA